MKAEDLNYKELQRELKSRGAKASGKKADLVKRLQDLLDKEDTNVKEEEDTKMDQEESGQQESKRGGGRC